MAKPKKKREQYIYPVDIIEVKDALQKEAYADNRSVHYLIKKILKDYINKPK